MLVILNGIQKRLPIVRLDGKDYFLLSGSYQRLHNEKIINERYTEDGSIDRQARATYKHRWQFTVVAPSSVSYITYQHPDPSKSFDFGTLGTIHATMDKLYPEDGLEYYDIDVLEDFSGTYTHYVYAAKEWEAPHGDDPGLWQVPITLWGSDA